MGDYMRICELRERKYSIVGIVNDSAMLAISNVYVRAITGYCSVLRIWGILVDHDRNSCCNVTNWS